MSQNRIAFVVNPVAGGSKKENIIKVISDNLPAQTSYDIFVWEEKNNFSEIKQQIVSGKYQTVVAVGGDGTVNKVAKNLLNTDIKFGIIPRGSGNGLARTLHIPQNTAEAVRLIERGSAKTIDCGFINDKPFFCTSGVGFDAHIGALFASSVKRGLSSYFKITVRELLRYRAKTYHITANGESFTTRAFLITFANAGQYGNDFYIAPQAKVDDGRLHVAIMSPFSPVSVWPLLFKILLRKAHRASKIHTFTTQILTVRHEGPVAIHYDGEPGFTDDDKTVIKIYSSSLRVIC